MDLSIFNPKSAVEKAQAMDLVHPTELTPIIDEAGNKLTFSVVGTQSTQGRNAINEAMKVLKDAEKYKAEDGEFDIEKVVKQEEIIEEHHAILATALCVGWSDNIELSSNPLPFTKKNADKLFKSQPWIAVQVVEFARNISNYVPRLKKD